MQRPFLAAGLLLAICALLGLSWFLLRVSEPVLPAIDTARESTNPSVHRSTPLEATAVPSAGPGLEHASPATANQSAQPEAKPATAPSTDEPLQWKDQIIERYSEPREPQHFVTLRGQVVDIAGRAVAGASVTVAGAVSSDKYMTKRGSLALATTGQDGDFQGRYTLPGTAVFELSLFASLDGLESERVLLAVRAGDTYECILITLPEGGSVSGQVVGVDFEPIAQVRIAVAHPPSERRERGSRTWPFGRAEITGPDGRFTVANLQPGEYQLTASASGYTSVTLTVAAFAGVDTELPSPVVLTAKTSITLKLTCPERQPNGKFSARFKRSDGSSVAKPANAAPDGRALIEDVPEDATEMTIEMPGFQPTTGIAIAPVKEAHVDVGEIELHPAQSEGND